MATAAFVIGFLAVGAAVAYVAFYGGPSGAREAYLTRGPRWFRIAIPILYIVLGIAIPAIVISEGQQAKGSDGALASTKGSTEFDEGRDLFRQACWTCHTLKAAGAQGVTGPNLDEAAPLTKERVAEVIEKGGNETGRMPAKLFSGKEAEAVSVYVSEVAGR